MTTDTAITDNNVPTPAQEQQVPPTEQPKPAKRKAKNKSTKPQKAKGKVKVAIAKKGVSVSATLRSIVVREPTIGLDELTARLAKQGFKKAKTTIATLQNDCVQTLRAAKDAGMYSGDL